jgi:hypothetical protein
LVSQQGRVRISRSINEGLGEIAEIPAIQKAGYIGSQKETIKERGFGQVAGMDIPADQTGAGLEGEIWITCNRSIPLHEIRRNDNATVLAIIPATSSGNIDHRPGRLHHGPAQENSATGTTATAAARS